MACTCACCGEFQANFSSLDEHDACRMHEGQQEGRIMGVLVDVALGGRIQVGWVGPASP